MGRPVMARRKAYVASPSACRSSVYVQVANVFGASGTAQSVLVRLAAEHQ